MKDHTISRLNDQLFDLIAGEFGLRNLAVVQLSLSYFFSYLPEGSALHGVCAALLGLGQMETAEPVPCSDYQIGLVLCSGQSAPERNPNDYYRAKGRWWRERLLEAQDLAGLRYFQYIEGKFDAYEQKNKPGSWVLILPDLLVEALELWIENGGLDLTLNEQNYAMRDAVRAVVINHRRRDAKLESKLKRKERRVRVRSLLSRVERICYEIREVAAECRERGESFFEAADKIDRCVNEEMTRDYEMRNGDALKGGEL